MAGLTSTGFVPKPLDDIKTDLGSGLRAVFGMAITLIAQSIFGLLIGVIAERLSDLWQLGLALYTASTREGATGIQLDHIGALTGTIRKAATFTKVTLHILGVNGTVITAGSVVSIPGVGTRFTNDAPGTVAGGFVDIEFRATITGPYAAPAGTVTSIETPIAGWNSVSNPLDESTLGSNIETDAAYRRRQKEELRAMGSSTTAAIRARLNEVTGVSEDYVFENNGDTVNADGLPGHSFECVVIGGTDAAVAGVIALQKPTGIATYGSTTTPAVDGNGFTVDTKFSRHTPLNIYATADIIADAGKFPTNGLALVKAAIVAYEENYRLGSEVRSSALVPNIFAAAPGILETTLPKIGTAASPTLTNTIAVNNRQKADLDTSRTIVNVTLINPS